jgi:hypothetical protein
MIGLAGKHDSSRVKDRILYSTRLTVFAVQSFNKIRIPRLERH